jgi:hypothetical protein
MDNRPAGCVSPQLSVDISVDVKMSTAMAALARNPMHRPKTGAARTIG